MIVVFFYTTDLLEGSFIIVIVVNGFKYESYTSLTNAKVIINLKFICIVVIYNNSPDGII